MKDYFGQELAVGDDVAFERPKYRELATGTIISFTPQKVRLAYNTTYFGPNHVGSIVDSKGRHWTDYFLTSPRDVIKKPV